MSLLRFTICGMKLKTVLVSGSAIAVAAGLTFGGFAIADQGAYVAPTSTPTATIAPATTSTPTATDTPTPVAAPTAAPVATTPVAAAPAPKPPASAPQNSSAQTGAPAIDPNTGGAPPVVYPTYIPSDPQPPLPPQYQGWTATNKSGNSYLLFKGCGANATECDTVTYVVP